MHLVRLSKVYQNSTNIYAGNFKKICIIMDCNINLKKCLCCKGIRPLSTASQLKCKMCVENVESSNYNVQQAV